VKQAPELRDAIARAQARAKAVGRSATVYDLYAALLEVPDIDRMIREAGGDARALASGLEAVARDKEDRAWPGLRWLTVAAADVTFRRTIVGAAIQIQSASRAEVRPADVFVAGYLSGDSGLASLLESAGISRLRALRWLCHGDTRGLPPSLPEGDMLDVVLLNDDYTTRRTVVQILTTVFGLGARAGHETMRTVHHEGSACVGRYPRDEAARLVRAATEMAEAEDAPLRIVLRRAEETDTAVPAQRAASRDSAPQASQGSFLVALLRRMSCRAPSDANSSDGMIFALGLVGLAVWLAFDRYAAGPDAQWARAGITGITWYAAGLLALTWVLDRTSRSKGGFRALLAGILGGVPLPLAFALAVHNWAPATLHRPAYALLALLILAHVRGLLTRAGASRPLAGMLALCGFTALFIWSTSQAFVYPHLWYEARDEDNSRAWDASERLLFEQADRIDAAAARLRAGEPDRPDVFFLGFAGEGHEKVFAEEIHLSERIIAERYGAAGRTLLLVNDRRDTEKWPLATVNGLRRALARIGDRMDRSEDVLFLMLTSHGSKRAHLSVSHETWPLEQLDARGLRSALDHSSIKWRVIVISACYSGAFIEPLADENTMIFTSAAKGRASFGCSDDRDVTEFGAAFIRDALPRASSLAAAFEQAKRTLAEQEQRERRTASLPQVHLGTAISAHWDRVEEKMRRGAVQPWE
jgi:ATP-dependent Clp protease adapter protein ClpS